MAGLCQKCGCGVRGERAPARADWRLATEANDLRKEGEEDEKSDEHGEAIYAGPGCLPAGVAGYEARGGRWQVQGRHQDVHQRGGDPGSRRHRLEGPASPYPAEIPIAGLKKGRVLDANLKLNGFSHTCSEDIDVLLVGPTGLNATPMSDMPPFSAIDGVNLTLDDGATDSWPVPLTSGAYRPTDNDAVGFDSLPAPSRGSVPPQDGGTTLSAFDCANLNGVWKLYVVDDTVGSLGQLAGGWSLTIKAKVRR